VYLHDVYAGGGLAGVPRGAIRKLRVVAYHFGYPNLAGPDKIGLGGPWEAMRILGTVPVEADGSAVFRVPANTPLTLQPLDAEGKAVQLMRSWYTAMPGERISCVGCHEHNNTTPVVKRNLAQTREPSEIEPWHGPARGFDFEREVQPVLDRHCVVCHDGAHGKDIPDLRAERFHPLYEGHVLAKLGATRLHPDLVTHFGGKRVKFTPAYEALIRYVRRVGIEDDVHMLVPGEYHADTSELVQMLAKGHHGVILDEEAWDRLITWIDLNAPCHGTWNDVAPIPERPDRRRWELSRRYGGPADDFEMVPNLPRKVAEPEWPERPSERPISPRLAGWPLESAEARSLQKQAGEPLTLDLGGGALLSLVKVPAGEFLMGDPEGLDDENPVTAVRIERSFWLGACEVTNRQFRRFDPNHRSGYFLKRYPGFDGPGIDLDGPDQPALRVSWEQAVEFCSWLSERTGRRVSLPTEAQWEYACRAGTDSALGYGPVMADFSKDANLADRALTLPTEDTGGLTTALTNPYFENRSQRGGKITGIMKDSLFAGDIPAVRGINDGVLATAGVGRFRPNVWGLHDMHGNVAEWTRSDYRPYPYRADDGRNGLDPAVKKVVRGGSFRDRPERCRSAFRLAYPAWQRVPFVGFRVVVLESR
jgi:formylglycine-generating enzyme required for sulfatase activity